MARIATGSIVADISGKVGDNIYSRNRQGPYVKTYAQPVQPGTSYQVAAQAAMATASADWAALSDQEYNNYVAFTHSFWKSSFCGKRRPDPKSFFIGNRINQITAGDTGVIPIPKMPQSKNISAFTIDVNTGTKLDYRFSGSSGTSQEKVIYYGTPLVPRTVRSLNTVPMVAFYSNLLFYNLNVDISSFWITRFGGTFQVANQRTFVKARLIDRLSGICVGEVWNSDVNVGGVPGYTIGNTDIRTTPQSLASALCTPVTTTTAGNISGVSVYSIAATGNIKVGLYSASGGNPVNLLASSGSLPVTGAGAFVLYPFTVPYAVLATTNYFIAAVSDGGINFMKDPLIIFQQALSGSGFNLPNPAGPNAQGAQGISNFATVTP